MKQEMQRSYDLVVVGGGLAGVCGAISARRLGSSVAIVQDRPVCGGNASSEIRVPIGGASLSNPFARETGVICELFLEERKRNFQQHYSSLTNSVLDLVLYDALRTEGVDIYLNTSCRKTIMKNKELIDGIYCIQVGNEKEITINGEYFLDASGDGVVGYTSGAEFMIGREGKGEFGESLAPEKPDKGIMGNSLMFLIKDCGEPVGFEPPSWIVKYPKDDVTLKLRGHNYFPGYWWIEIGCPYDTISDNEEIKHNLLAHLLGVWDHLKNEDEHGFNNYSLEWIGMLPGKRESRRFIGDYILKEQDIKERKMFEDAVAYGGWYIDLHTPGGILAKEEYPEPAHSGRMEEIDSTRVYVYSIPYRCIYSRNIKNLFLAGRNISVTHVALGSTRLMGTCALLGQSAGTSAYLCKKYKVYPRDIFHKYIKELQQQLLKDGCFIPGIKNEDETDLMKKAKLTSSSQMILTFPEAEKEIPLDIPRGELFSISGDYLDSISLPIRSLLSQKVVAHLRKAKDIWDYSAKKDIATVESYVNEGENIVTFKFSLKLSSGLYWIWFGSNKNLFIKYGEKILHGCVLLCRPGKKWYLSSENLWDESGKKSNISMIVTPVISPYGPENINSGVCRPEKWTNVWISDPDKKMPQELEIELDREQEINHIQLIFDAELNFEYYQLPPFYVPPTIPKDFNVYVEKSGNWNLVLEVRNNTKYFCRYQFSPVRSKKVKIEFISTNGSNHILVYEIRLYKN